MLQTIQKVVGRKWIEALSCLILGGALFGSGYWLGQRSVPQRMNGFQAANLPRAPWSPATGAMPRPLSQVPPMPEANASPEMKEFMQNRATLMQKMNELRQQNPSANGVPDPQLITRFQQENAALLQRQKELSQIISQQQNQNPLAPPPLKIPEGASPELKAYLTSRDQLMRDQIAFIKQHSGDAPAARQAAMQQWRKDNDSRFQELRQEAQTISQQNAAAGPVTASKTGT